jgi:hypothetical protein
MVRIAVLALLFGCGTTPPPTTEPPAIAARLHARGYTVEPLASGETLACGRGGCVCLADLACDGGCMTAETNLAVFAAAHRTGTVACGRAERGKLCDFSFFRFEGDLYRSEQRYFASSGRLVGIREVTEVPHWCGGRARARFTGLVPDCGQAPRDVTVVCDDARAYPAVGNPAAQLEQFLDGR